MREIKIELIWLPESEGGRKKLTPGSPWMYRPHLVAGGSDEYLGVQFLEGDTPSLSLTGTYLVRLMYEGAVD